MYAIQTFLQPQAAEEHNRQQWFPFRLGKFMGSSTGRERLIRTRLIRSSTLFEVMVNI